MKPARAPDAAGGPEPAPWSLRPPRVGPRALLAVGAGSLIASFYIGTGDIAVATWMGARFGLSLWWTYFVLGLAAWALIDMTARYYLRFGRTPMSIFKETHPAVTAYMVAAVIVCAILGSYSQWNACAMVITGFLPGLPVEASGAIAAGLALLLLGLGAYARIERIFIAGIAVLIAVFFLSALSVGIDARAALGGLVPNAPGPGWQDLFRSNAGSIINAWLILIYPYTMIERGWYARRLEGKLSILKRARFDYGWGILAAGVVALPIMASAAAVARPFGIQPRSYMDFAVLLEPFAGPWATHLFLSGLFLAAWTAGVGWWLAGAYALLDLFGLPIRAGSRGAKGIVLAFAIPSVLLLFLRIDPAAQIIIFAAFLAVVFPVVGIALVARIARRDMGYFRWTLRNPRGIIVVVLDLFALALSLYVGWFEVPSRIGRLLGAGP